MSSYYLVVITANDCGHCKRFMQYDEKNLMTKLHSIPNVDMFRIKMDSMDGTSSNDQSLMSQYGFIMNNVTGYPTFLLITQDNFNQKNASGIIPLSNGSVDSIISQVSGQV